MNPENKQDPLDGKVTGSFDPTKKEMTLKLDDNLGEALIANTIFLTYQEAKPETLSGELQPDTETKPETPPEPQPPPAPTKTTPSKPVEPAPTPPAEPAQPHNH